MTQSLVSIVIAAHNNWPDLELAIQSALNQSYESVEVIVIDNSSTDETQLEVPRKFKDVLTFCRQNNRGEGGAYNTGFSLSKGDFVQFLDGDDFLAPDKVEKQVSALQQDSTSAIAYGDVRRFQSGVGTPDWEDWDTYEYRNVLDEVIDPVQRYGGPWIHSVLMRREVIEVVGPWDESLYIVNEDYWLRASWAGFRFTYTPGALAFYRRRNGQKSEDSVANFRATEKVWEKALTYVTSEPHASGLAARLAGLRYSMAVRREDLGIYEAMTKLRAAYTTPNSPVSTTAYVLGVLAVILPGGSIVARHPWFRGLRRALAKKLDVR